MKILLMVSIFLPRRTYEVPSPQLALVPSLPGWLVSKRAVVAQSNLSAQPSATQDPLEFSRATCTAAAFPRGITQRGSSQLVRFLGAPKPVVARS